MPPFFMKVMFLMLFGKKIVTPAGGLGLNDSYIKCETHVDSEY